jgi:hypothetical protein
LTVMLARFIPSLIYFSLSIISLGYKDEIDWGPDGHYMWIKSLNFFP